MPIWLQLVTAVSAGGVSALLGIALMPYLKKLRYFPPQAPKPDAAQESEGESPKTEHPEAVQEEQRPIMGGLLTAAGILFALVLGGTLFLQFGGADRTGSDFSDQLSLLEGMGVYIGTLWAVGVLNDWQMVHKRFNPTFWFSLTLPIVLIAGLLTVSIVFVDATMQQWYLILLPVVAVLCFGWMCDLERNTDGAMLTVNAVELLFLTMLLLKRSMYLPSLLTLASAGACLGSLVWCLHPAKCQMGRTGQFLLAAIVPIVCLLCGMYKELALFMAVCLLQRLYRFRKPNHQFLTEAMADSGIQPHARIGILTGIAAFCGVMALLLK